MSQFKQKEERWIDFLEDELERSLKEDLSIIATHSEEDQKLLKSLQKTRHLLETAGPYETSIPIDEAYYDSLHDKIMQNIEVQEVASPVVANFQKHMVQYAVAACLLIVSGISLYAPMMEFFGPSKAAKVAKINKPDWILEETNPIEANFSDTVLTYEDENDFILDTTANEIKGLSDKKLREVFDKAIQ